MRPRRTRTATPLKTSTDYRSPYRPLPVSLFNRAGRMARRLGFDGALDVDRMIAAARRKTGLSHFGDEWFLEPLEVLVRSINDEARLTPLGTRIQHSRIVSALAIRLRAEELLREKPGHSRHPPREDHPDRRFAADRDDDAAPVDRGGSPDSGLAVMGGAESGPPPWRKEGGSPAP